MKFRTTFPLKKQSKLIDHHHPILLMGSCFSENIGNKLNKHKFTAMVNPLGIAYNPISLHQLLLLNQSKTDHWLSAFQLTDEMYFNYHLHSSFNDTSKASYTNKLKEAIRKIEAFLSRKPTIILSYGTAWVYELKTQKGVINNCHKQPSGYFNKRLLDVEEITRSWVFTRDELKKNYGQSFHFIFTISPVRHIKDGFEENQLSKSILNLAIHQICDENENCSYFPSYEIMMDDLRDYRFYKEDLLHPNEMAIEYIWQKFSSAYFSEKTTTYNKEIEKLTQAVDHKAFNASSQAHQDFLKRLFDQIRAFSEKSKISFEEEKQQILDQIK